LEYLTKMLMQNHITTQLQTSDEGIKRIDELLSIVDKILIMQA
jgi:hypothetical protein